MVLLVGTYDMQQQQRLQGQQQHLEEEYATITAAVAG
jgi:hypothetical protein